jgi:8-oxo-dGTP diphosphatase
MEIPSNFFRVSAKALIRDGEGRLLLVKESIGVWELPGGGVEFGEDPRDAVRRELAEEGGFDVASVAEKARAWVAPNKNSQGEPYWCLLLGFDTELASGAFTPSDEAVEFRFFTKDEAAALELDPKVRAGLAILF